MSYGSDSDPEMLDRMRRAAGAELIPRAKMNPWVPMTRPLDLKHMGKLSEELGECIAAVSRCLIQGIDECEPATGKLNRSWLEEEIADVLANISLVQQHFKLNALRIENRSFAKMTQLREWHAMLVEADA